MTSILHAFVASVLGHPDEDDPRNQVDSLHQIIGCVAPRNTRILEAVRNKEITLNEQQGACGRGKSWGGERSVMSAPHQPGHSGQNLCCGAPEILPISTTLALSQNGCVPVRGMSPLAREMASVTRPVKTGTPLVLPSTPGSSCREITVVAMPVPT